MAKLPCSYSNWPLHTKANALVNHSIECRCRGCVSQNPILIQYSHCFRGKEDCAQSYRYLGAEVLVNMLDLAVFETHLKTEIRSTRFC